MTVFNERDSVDRFFRSLAEFTRLPDEVVIVDGGSTDDTVEIIKSHVADAPVPVTLVEEQRCNISRGRNLAIRHAKHDLIAVTDMGCRIPEDWLEGILAPFDDDDALEVVGGYYGYHCDTPLQRCFADLRHKARLDTKSFYPSSRSLALKRHVWEAVGGYPEHMTVGEDMYFDLRIRERGFRETIAADAKVYWEAPASYRAVRQKYYRYARSAGAVFQQPAIYGFYMAAYALFVAWIVLAIVGTPLFLAVLAVQSAAYAHFRMFRKEPVRRRLTPGNLWRYCALTAVLDASTILGYLAGLSLAIRGRTEVWTPPPEGH